MIECYHRDAVFTDPLFTLQGVEQIGRMWRALCNGATDFTLQHDVTAATDDIATVVWVATYRFSRTGRMVTNRVTARLRIVDGQIVEHTDTFDLWAWSRQALGLPGVLLGWAPPFRRVLRRRAQAGIA
jgi:hypothetical protein